MRFIFIVIVWLLLMVGLVAVGLYHFLGWKGVLAFPVVMIVLALMGKFFIKRLVRRLFMIPFKMKSGVLHKAKMEVHSVKPVTVLRRMDEVSEEEDEKEEVKHFYEVDLTITPKGSGDRVWEPTEFILTTEPVSKLEDLEDKEVGSVHVCHVWDGNEFGLDEPGKYPGEQRLKLTFEVKQGTSKGWLHYYDEPIGEIKFPAWSLSE